MKPGDMFLSIGAIIFDDTSTSREEGIKKKLNALFVKAYITSLQMKV